MAKYNPEIAKELEKEWKDKKIEIIDKTHPFKNKIGEVTGVDYTEFGYALLVNIQVDKKPWICRVISISKKPVNIKFDVKIIL